MEINVTFILWQNFFFAKVTLIVLWERVKNIIFIQGDSFYHFVFLIHSMCFTQNTEDWAIHSEMNYVHSMCLGRTKTKRKEFKEKTRVSTFNNSVFRVSQFRTNGKKKHFFFWNRISLLHFFKNQMIKKHLNITNIWGII